MVGGEVDVVDGAVVGQVALLDLLEEQLRPRRHVQVVVGQVGVEAGDVLIHPLANKVHNLNPNCCSWNEVGANRFGNQTLLSRLCNVGTF